MRADLLITQKRETMMIMLGEWDSSTYSYFIDEELLCVRIVLVIGYLIGIRSMTHANELRLSGSSWMLEVVSLLKSIRFDQIRISTN